MRFLVDMALSSGLAAWLVGQGTPLLTPPPLEPERAACWLRWEHSCGAAVRVRWARLCVVLTR